MYNGLFFVPRDAQEAFRLITERGSPRITEFREYQYKKLGIKALRLTPKARRLHIRDSGRYRYRPL